MKYKWISLCVLLSCSQLLAQNQEIRIWSGKAPGSENWTIPEKVTEGSGGKNISNVSDPTLTVYLPDPAKNTGAALIICPGGALRYLSMNEPLRLAAWLNSKGIAAFILKYRTLQTQEQVPGSTPARSAANPVPPLQPQERKELEIKNANANPDPTNAEHSKIIALATSDGQEAIRIVRNKAAEWRINPKAIGILGISAGGAVVFGSALADYSDAYPDFIVSVYGPSLVDVNVPKHAAPLFIAVGAGHFNVTNGCVALFTAWREAGKPVELHVYDLVNGPFSSAQKGLPVESWPDRLYEWLAARGFLRK